VDEAVCEVNGNNSDPQITQIAQIQTLLNHQDSKAQRTIAEPGRYDGQDGRRGEPQIAQMTQIQELLNYDDTTGTANGRETARIRAQRDGATHRRQAGRMNPHGVLLPGCRKLGGGSIGVEQQISRGACPRVKPRARNDYPLSPRVKRGVCCAPDEGASSA
jgi:hypothetical protein